MCPGAIVSFIVATAAIILLQLWLKINLISKYLELECLMKLYFFKKIMCLLNIGNPVGTTRLAEG